MSYQSNIGPYPSKSAKSAAGWVINIGADSAALFGAGALYWDMPTVSFLNTWQSDTLIVDIAIGGDTATATYQWYKDGSSMGASYQDRVLDILSLAVGDAGTYYCVATNGLGSATSNSVTVYVRPAIVTGVYSSNRGPFFPSSPRTMFVADIGLPIGGLPVAIGGRSNVLTVTPKWWF